MDTMQIYGTVVKYITINLRPKVIYIGTWWFTLVLKRMHVKYAIKRLHNPIV